MAERGVEIETTIGTFVIELYVHEAPRTCKNFAELARRGYYNGALLRCLSAPRDLRVQRVNSSTLLCFAVL